MSEDRFLDGRIRVTQPDGGFRAGIDAVLLAASLVVRSGETLVELGCGAGTATLCAAARSPEGRFRGIDIDPDMIALAQANAAANGLAERAAFETGDVALGHMAGPVDQVFFNPPFFDDPSALRPPKPGKTRAYLTGDTSLADWVGAARRLLKPKGRVTLIHRADRLGDILTLLQSGWGDVAIRPIHPRADSAAKRVLVSARRDTKGALHLHPPLVLHDDAGGQYSAEAEAILRGRAGIVM
ncbi:MAG: methyltransferase [Maricaulis sp.]|nr:methyltransferase [Maricaulis sp.]HAQ36476.1 methyltransferase [Alphaproteobacteria bacterium]